MKKLLTLLLVITPWLSNAQALFGYSPTEIRTKWSEMEFRYDKWGEEKNLMMMSFTKEKLNVTYFFDEDNKSIITTLVPLTQGHLQAVIEHYNKRYVIVDSYTWRFYDDGSIYLCELKQTNDGRYYFMWSIDK